MQILHLLPPPEFPIISAFLLIACIIVQVTGDGYIPQTTATPPPHRGAARQMYGSGSLRPPGTKPIYATGQRQHGVRTTVNPPYLQNEHKMGLPYFIQVPVRMDEMDAARRAILEKIGNGYIVNPQAIPPFRQKPIPIITNRGGLYGGRPEYYNGRPPYLNGHAGWEAGLLEGKGFTKGRSNPIGKYIVPGTQELGIGRDSLLKHPDDDVELETNYKFESPCLEDCPKGQFFCSKSCMCIDEKFRCDGDSDCTGNEDEYDCADYYQTTVKCDETKNFVACPGPGAKCISKDWLCDGDDDCGDFSDETHCGFAINCTSEQFECNNGLCIPKTWTCDNDNDCKDSSDEYNCTKQGCTNDEFECSDSSCISLSWKCDGQDDCPDRSDEHDCDLLPPICIEKEFQCANKKCTKIEFKCDGDNDCEDWSDENDCPKIIANCGNGEFKCNSGKCIPDRYRCDHQNDCEEEEDEANCDFSVTKSCSPEEFTCDNGTCILKNWVCDGFNDCRLGEDESKCDIECDQSKFPCVGIDVKTTVFCISRKNVCDGQNDCPMHEDEENCPTKRECEHGTKCKQLCITTSTGINACACLPGYKLADDGYNCIDIDECMYATDPVCSQTCNNTIGSFRCGCMTGYVLRPDLRTCKAMGAPPTLLFANRMDIRQISLTATNSKYTAILKGLHNAIALDYHYELGFIFWSDVSLNVIRRAYINGSGTQDIIKWGLESPGGVALDWIHNLIFWTDSGTRRIEVASLDGAQRAVIAANEVDKPRAIAVHPGEALIFWTDWGPFPKIERAEMDGTNRKSVITESVFWPNGLTIDYTTDRIYWADAKHNVIETARFDGSDRKKVISKGLPHPFAITIFEDAIYWTDWHTKSISTGNKLTGAGFKTIYWNLHFPMDIHSYHPQRQPKYRNHCGANNGGCAHMCIPNGKSYACRCKMDQKLKADKRGCQTPDKFLLFVKQKELRIKHLDTSSKQYDVVIPVDGIKSAVAIAWDSKTDYIYWSDVEKDVISRAFWNGTNQQEIVKTNIVTPAGLALDWITDKIYWTDADTSRIEVANTNGSMRSLLIWDDLGKPRDIVVDPLGGYMYWSDWGDKPRIERAHMDGTNRIQIASDNLTYPNGLAVDHAAGKIYWTDGGSKSIICANFNGSNRKVILEGDNIPHPFGLDVYENAIYWTDWQTLNIERANKLTGANRTILSNNMNNLMDVRVFHRNRKYIKTACNTQNGGCSHLCLLRPKGHTCACPTGIKLDNDEKTCANGPLNYLILAHRVDIRQISLDVPYTADVVLPISSLKKATSVDVDRKTGEIYWSDTAEDVIQKSFANGTNLQTVIMHEMKSADGIAIDSTGRKIYWTDGERNSIEVSELDGRNRKVLFFKDLQKPRAITLHYHHGLMFWSDWGEHAKIEVAQMDGTRRRTLITDHLEWPNGLTIDRPVNRLYWTDGKLNKIESSDLNGKDRKLVISNVDHPYGLVVVGTHIYWTDWQTKALHRADKNTGADSTIIKGQLEGLMDVRSVQNDNIAENACGPNNGGCSHLCLRNPDSFTCECPTGLMKINEKKCVAVPDTFLLLATRYSLTQISLDSNDWWEVTMNLPQIQNVIDLDYHWKKKLIFYTDIGRNVIESVSMLNTSDVKVIVKDDLVSVDGVAVDWLAENLYWTNTGRKLIEVSRLDGTKRKVVLRSNLEDPRSIVVYPRKGYLYWTDWGVKPKIEKSYLDGSSRHVLVNTDLNFPIGLTIDYDMKRIYWIDAKMNGERVETIDLQGRNRVILNIQGTKPFSLSQFGVYLYWTDWAQKSVLRADKITGKDATVIRTNLEAALGVQVVAKARQTGWNPCMMNNGGCSELCLFKNHNYTCGCSDSSAVCNAEPQKRVDLNCPENAGYDCTTEEEDDEIEEPLDPETSNKNDDINEKHPQSHLFYVMTLVPMLCLIFLCLILVTFVLVKKGKKKYIYASGRSFSNPNYYSASASSGTDPQNAGNNPNGGDRKQFLWKRLKYDKSQDRVYEETTGTNSPEIASLIPTIMTPCSSNCDEPVVTPELERSPSVTPLHKIEQQPPQQQQQQSAAK